MHRIETNLVSIQKELNLNIQLPDYCYDSSYRNLHEEGINRNSGSYSGNNYSNAGGCGGGGGGNITVRYGTAAPIGQIVEILAKTGKEASDDLLLLTGSRDRNSGSISNGSSSSSNSSSSSSSSSSSRNVDSKDCSELGRGVDGSQVCAIS